MHVARLSLTPLKGTAHTVPSRLTFDEHGPRDDRRFCLVDLQRARVLRTVENPALVGVHASYDGSQLAIRLRDGSTVSGVTRQLGESFTVDYWGRRANVTVVEGPWAMALSRVVGHEVVLAEVTRPGEVVFGGAVVLLTTSSLREVASRVGRELAGEALLDDSERFRSTIVIDTGAAPAFVEDGWEGCDVSLGEVTVRVRGAVPRCAVVRISPRHGGIDEADPLGALASDRTELNMRGREVVFGVDADMVLPGTVEVGDAVQVSGRPFHDKVPRRRPRQDRAVSQPSSSTDAGWASESGHTRPPVRRATSARPATPLA